ncbi:MAG: hypothetical protein D6785_09980, partial [Planctomycetota bacterium]
SRLFPKNLKATYQVSLYLQKKQFLFYKQGKKWLLKSPRLDFPISSSALKQFLHSLEKLKAKYFLPTPKIWKEGKLFFSQELEEYLQNAKPQMALQIRQNPRSIIPLFLYPLSSSKASFGICFNFRPPLYRCHWKEGFQFLQKGKYFFYGIKILPTLEGLQKMEFHFPNGKKHVFFSQEGLFLPRSGKSSKWRKSRILKWNHFFQLLTSISPSNMIRFPDWVKKKKKNMEFLKWICYYDNKKLVFSMPLAEHGFHYIFLEGHSMGWRPSQKWLKIWNQLLKEME